MKPSRSRLAGSQESDAPRRVWLDYEEFQADTPDVVGFYRRRQDAEEAAENCRRQARDDYGWVVYGDEDDHGNEIASGDVDVHVEAHSVQPPNGRREVGD